MEQLLAESISLIKAGGPDAILASGILMLFVRVRAIDKFIRNGMSTKVSNIAESLEHLKGVCEARRDCK